MDFEDIYNKYYKDIYAFVLSISHSSETAEEITQETFYKALKSYDNFQGDCKVSVWLCQIAKNTFFTSWKKQSKFKEVELSIIPDESDFETQLLNKSSALQLHKVLHCLCEPYKEVFTLRVFGELSFREIGLLFDRTENWARVTYYRAKIKIKFGIEEKSL